MNEDQEKKYFEEVIAGEKEAIRLWLSLLCWWKDTAQELTEQVWIKALGDKRIKYTVIIREIPWNNWVIHRVPDQENYVFKIWHNDHERAGPVFDYFVVKDDVILGSRQSLVAFMLEFKQEKE